jgi:hypothetical protein
MALLQNIFCLKFESGNPACKENYWVMYGGNNRNKGRRNKGKGKGKGGGKGKGKGSKGGVKGGNNPFQSNNSYNSGGQDQNYGQGGGKGTCRFGSGCTRANCHFDHPEGKDSDGNGFGQGTNEWGNNSGFGQPAAGFGGNSGGGKGGGKGTCRFGSGCTRANCHFDHPEGKDSDGTSNNTGFGQQANAFGAPAHASGFGNGFGAAPVGGGFGAAPVGGGFGAAPAGGGFGAAPAAVSDGSVQKVEASLKEMNKLVHPYTCYGDCDKPCAFETDVSPEEMRANFKDNPQGHVSAVGAA